MRFKKILKYILLFLLIGSIIFVILAQRDIKRIYGGLTEHAVTASIQGESDQVVITNLSVLSPDSAYFLPSQSVVIRDGIIESIDSSFVADGDIHVIDGSGKYLIPGLIDAHVHLWKSPNDLLLYLANGVTGVRELVGNPDHIRWREEIRNGRIGPDLYVSSPRLGSFSGFESWFMEWAQAFNSVSNRSDAEALVREYADVGYDAIKIYSHLNKEAYIALNELAPEAGLEVVGHIPWSIELSDLWNYNQKDIAHLEELMNALRREFGDTGSQEKYDEFLAYVDARSDEIVTQMVENDISVTTTLWLVQSFVRQKFELDQVLGEVELEYENPGISEWSERLPRGLGWLPAVNRYAIPEMESRSAEDLEKIKMFWIMYGDACELLLKNLYTGGVTIMAGTDANIPPTVPGFSLHDELISMQDAGMAPYDILRSATIIPAERMKWKSGSIQPGFKANLVLLENNPLEDIRNTKAINMVVVNGQLYDRTQLDNMLEAVKQANDESRTEDISTYSRKID